MAVMKKCFKCGIEKSLSEFYKRSDTTDGYFGKCKTCCKQDSKLRYDFLSEDPLFIEKERERGREKYRRLAYREKQKPTIRRAINTRKHKARYPEKVLARNATQYLFRKPGYHLHHWSYRPEHNVDVIELSIQDHNTVHRFLIYDQERMQYRCLNGILLDTRQAHEEYIAMHIDNI